MAKVSGHDTLKFGEGLRQSDMVQTQDNNNLIITFVGNSKDQITIKNHFYYYNPKNYRIENLEFTSSDVITGTDSAETLNGTFGDDEIHGLAGNDILRGQEGADILNGGEGTDRASYRSRELHRC